MTIRLSRLMCAAWLASAGTLHASFGVQDMPVQERPVLPLTQAPVGFQVFGAQHVAALGDLQTADEDIEDVVGNFWSLGVAIVIR